MATKLPAPDRARDAARSREAILDAAERLFAARGFEATSLQEVGEAAGLSRGSPGYFFGSKQELYEAVLTRCYARATHAVRSGLARALRSGEPADVVLAGAVGEYFDFLTANEPFMRLLEWEALGGGGVVAGLPPHAEALQEALTALVTELGLARHRRAEAAHLLLSVMALCWFPVIHATTLLPGMGLDPQSPSFRAERRRHVVELVRQGMSSIIRTRATRRPA